jgi:glycosyltransferase involved in cell wall biosynthesis
MKVVSVIIDPITNVYYAAFYIKALMDRFGKSNVIFDAKPFKCLVHRVDNFNFIVNIDSVERKYSIHFDDPFHIKAELYEWCDVYGNVNANFSQTPTEFHSKLVSLVPSFGIRIWNFPQTCYYAMANGSKILANTDIKKFIGKYRRQWELRIPLEAYESHGADVKMSSKYVFHLSTLWYSNQENKNDENVNLIRANFIRACRSIDGVDFEGGFSKTPTSTLNELFKPLIYSEFIPFKDYLNKIKASVVVFNTPAFWNCHGWKLGEYLCLGKAIISTVLSNDLPAPLVHGEHIHYVDNDENAMREAILKIVNNDEYRMKLETGARKYWEEFGAPIKSLELLGL